MIPDAIPADFDEAAYLRWHDATFPEDAPLKQNLESYCIALKYRAPSAYLDAVAQLLSQMCSHCATEVDINSRGLMAGTYQSMLPGGKKKNPYPPTTFKSVESIIDKLWRKNSTASSQDDRVSISTLNKHIRDLMRTSVVAPTFHHARFFADHLRDWKKVIRDEAAKRKHFSAIVDVVVDVAAKLESGYFAYHCSVLFQDGYAVEVQVYSQLTEAWRRLSHHVYEKTRIVGGSQGRDRDQTALVSLGHLLHVAELDLERLAENMKN